MLIQLVLMASLNFCMVAGHWVLGHIMLQNFLPFTPVPWLAHACALHLNFNFFREQLWSNHNQ